MLWRHALPNALGPAIVATTLGVGNAILLESGLSFLGLGIQPPPPSWGNMIAGGRDLIVAAPWVAIAPGLALVATVLACTLLGDALRDRLAGETGATLRDAPERSATCERVTIARGAATNDDPRRRGTISTGRLTSVSSRLVEARLARRVERQPPATVDCHRRAG